MGMSSTVSLQDILKSKVLKARTSAKRLGLNIRDQDLFKLSRLVQQDKAQHIRNISEYRAVFSAVLGEVTYFFSYNTRYKIADQFFTKKDASLQVRDKVWFWQDKKKISGFIAISVPAYEDPKFSAFEQGGFDLSRLPPVLMKRPQHSYVVAVEEGDVHYLYWPHLRVLRKGYAETQEDSQKTQKGRQRTGRDSFRGSRSQKSYQSR
jgi:hypothetical protein